MVTHPRVIYFDTRGNATHFAAQDSGVDAASDVFSSWQGAVSVTEAPQNSSSRFLKEGSNVWNYDAGSNQYSPGEEGVYGGDEYVEYDSWTGEEVVRRRNMWEPGQYHGGVHEREEEEEDDDEVVEEAKYEGDDEEGHMAPIQDAEVKEWSDFLRVHLHPRSLNEIPIWQDDTYNTFFSGMSKEFISSTDFEDLYDNFRFLLEECDRLICVDVSVDGSGGAGGFAARMLEEVRDDLGSGVTMPIWLFTDPEGRENSCENIDDKAATIRDCGVPFAYSTFCQFSSVLIPLDMSTFGSRLSSYGGGTFNTFRSSALAASAIETALSGNLFDVRTGTTQPAVGGAGSARRTMPLNNMSAWCDAVTHRSNFPVAGLESLMPISSDSTKSTDFLGPVGGIRSGVNHFLVSLSSALSGRFSLKSANFKSATFKPAQCFTNVIYCRGISEGLWMKAIEARQAEKPFPLSFHETYRAPIPVPLTYPDVGVARGGTFCAISAVGTGAYLGEHICSLRDIWLRATSRKASNVLSQLEGLNVEEDQCAEVTEKLTQMSERMQADW